MNKTSFINTDKHHIWHPFDAINTTENICIEKAEGIYLIDTNGRKIIDGIGSWWVNIHGHCHPTLVKALTSQASQLEHVIFSGFTHKPALEFTQKFINATENIYQKIFYSDNGSTAVEVALKLAFQYWHNKGIKRTKALAIEGAYHGDTFGAMATGDRSKFNEPFFPFLFDVEFIPFPTDSNHDQIISFVEEKLSTLEYASFIFEPLIQGAAGMRIYSPQILDQILSICNKYQTITIADEVFTGFYRTGKFLASDYLTTNPDILCLSKAITGGFLPLGATVCKSFIFDEFVSNDIYKTFFHGHSYTGNPLALCLASSSLDLLLEPQTFNSIEIICKEQQLFAIYLNEKYSYAKAQVVGTILSIEILNTTSKGYFSSLKDEIYHYFLEKDILLRPLGNVIYFLPMYCFTTDNLKVVHNAIDAFLNERIHIK